MKLAATTASNSAATQEGSVQISSANKRRTAAGCGCVVSGVVVGIVDHSPARRVAGYQVMDRISVIFIAATRDCVNLACKITWIQRSSLTNRAYEGESVGRLGNLDDEDYPAFTTGQAAKMLGVQEAFLRSLDDADLVSPQRSEGGHRRYSRRQLEHALRIRGELDEGHTLAAASRITDLQDQLADAEDTITDLRKRLDEQETG